MKLCDYVVAAAAGSFVRGVLETIHLLMEHGHYVDKNGRPIEPDFGAAARRTRFAKFSVQTLVSAVFGSYRMRGVKPSGPRCASTVAVGSIPQAAPSDSFL